MDDKIKIYIGQKGIFKIATVIYFDDTNNEIFYFDNNPVANLCTSFLVHYVFSLTKKSLDKKVCKLIEKIRRSKCLSEKRN